MTTYQLNRMGPASPPRPAAWWLAWLRSLLLMVALAPTMAIGASLTTDQLDYPPYTEVFISGSGFQGATEDHPDHGEKVTLTLYTQNEDGSWSLAPSDVDYPNPWELTADANGNISDAWFVWTEEFLWVNFKLTALGQASGELVETFFTDGITSVTVVNPTGIPSGGYSATAGDTFNVPYAFSYTTGGGTTSATWQVYLKLTGAPNTEYLIASGTDTGLTNGTHIVGSAGSPSQAAVAFDGAGGNPGAGTFNLLVKVTKNDGTGAGNANGTSSVSPYMTVTGGSSGNKFGSMAVGTASGNGECKTSQSVSYDLNLTRGGSGKPAISGDLSLAGSGANPLPAAAVAAATFSTDPVIVGSGDDIVNPVSTLTLNSSTLSTGTYEFTVTITDGSSTASGIGTITVVDTKAPVITLNGEPTMTLECHVDNYTELGASVSDACDTGLTAAEVAGDAVDVNVPGTYVVTYNATDASGNPAMEVTRTVNVVDTKAPVITLNGEPTMTLECHVDNYTELGASVSDACDTGLTAAEVAGDAVDVNVPGTYVVTYKATDASGNPAMEVTRTVNVVDTTAPTLSEVPTDENLGCNPDDIPDEAYIEALVTAIDACDNEVSIDAVATDGVGAEPCTRTRTFTITATDDSGQAAIASVTYTWTEDTQKPVVQGAPLDVVVVQVAEGACEIALDLDDDIGGAPTATDNCSEDPLTAVGTRSDAEALDAPYPVGCTTITWTAEDGCGNVSDPVTQTILVEPNLPDAAYTGDTMVFTAGPTAPGAPVTLKAEFGAADCLDWSAVQARFKVCTTGVTSTEVTSADSVIDETGHAEVTVTLNASASYHVKVYLVYCPDPPDFDGWEGTFVHAEGCVMVDFGSTNRRIVGGGWIFNDYSANDKGSFGFVANYKVTKNKITAEGNSVYMIHDVDGYNWKVKDTAWNTSSMSFYKNSAYTGGPSIDCGRVQFTGVVQKIDAVTGEVVTGGFGSAKIVIDVFDGDLWSPAKKDAYSIKIYKDSTLWWGSNTSWAPLGNGGPGGGNVKVFAK